MGHEACRRLARPLPGVLDGPGGHGQSAPRQPLTLSRHARGRSGRLAAIILPSLAVLARGMIFGPFTIFLVFMIPLIWIGNSLLVLSMKLDANKLIRLLLGAGAKTIFIAATAFVLVKLGIIPDLFLTTMGMVQLYTAVAGGLLALGIQHVKEKLAVGK